MRSALDRVAAEWNALQARKFAGRLRAEAQEDTKKQDTEKESNESTKPQRKRGLPSPPSWWNDNTASMESIVAARQLSALKK